MPKVKKVFVIIANPARQMDNQSERINTLCKTFLEACQKQDCSVDVLDLYTAGFDPVLYPDNKDSSVIEYQIRIQKADIIAIFHPVWWGGPPAILKGFFDKVFQSGFAFSRHEQFDSGLLKGKKVIVCAFAGVPVWHLSVLYGNSLKYFWQRALFDRCGMSSQIFQFGSLRKASTNTINRWNTQMIRIAQRYCSPSKE